MGIRPNGDGAIPPVTPDNPETRYSDWLTDLEDSGEIVGGVWRETDAKASSASNGISDLAGRVAALETGAVKPHTHVSADITDARHYVGANLLLKMDGNGNFHVANPTEETHPAHKRYVDAEVQAATDSASADISDLDGRVAELETAEVKPHTHTSSDITDARHYVGANRLLKMDGEGHINVADPTEETHPAHKRYVDTEVKAVKDNAVPWIRQEGIVRRDTNGLFHVPEPTVVSHPASKQYVDNSGLDRLFVVRAASTGYNPDTVIAGLPTGQVYIDLRDMSINVKD